MATHSTSHPTLLDLAKQQDPDGSIATVGEILHEQNEILDDIVFQEGNLPTGHRTTIRSGLPTPTWRKLYGGVQPTKGETVQITDSTGMLEAYAEVDQRLADLSGNVKKFRMNEDAAHLEGMNQELVDTMFYGNEATEPEAFTGLAPRFNDLSAENADNIIDAGGVQSDNSSIWLVVWGPNTAFGLVPKGSTAGLKMEDKGRVTIENIDGAGGRMEAYRTHYTWDAGLTVKDWRYIVRICNIDKSLLIKDMSTGADINDLLVQAIELIPNLNMGQPAIYVPRSIRSMMRRQTISAVGNSTLSMDTIAGKKVVMFDGIPVRRCDALSGDEARIV